MDMTPLTNRHQTAANEPTNQTQTAATSTTSVFATGSDKNRSPNSRRHIDDDDDDPDDDDDDDDVVGTRTQTAHSPRVLSYSQQLSWDPTV